MLEGTLCSDREHVPYHLTPYYKIYHITWTKYQYTKTIDDCYNVIFTLCNSLVLITAPQTWQSVAYDSSVLALHSKCVDFNHQLGDCWPLIHSHLHHCSSKVGGNSLWVHILCTGQLN